MRAKLQRSTANIDFLLSVLSVIQLQAVHLLVETTEQYFSVAPCSSLSKAVWRWAATYTCSTRCVLQHLDGTLDAAAVAHRFSTSVFV